ncbi:MAG: DUF3078 domain-containing protein [Aureispira sp.]
MKAIVLTIVMLIMMTQVTLQAQDKEGEDEKYWTAGGAAGLDLGQMLFINPKFGAGEDRIGVAGNINLYAKYKKGRVSWDNLANLNFGVQRLGSLRKEIPFQKSVDELRFASNFSYGITEDSPFGYSLDALLLTQITPTYDGNLLAPADTAPVKDPIAQFFSPTTLTVSPGISYKKTSKFGEFNALLSPASVKMILVGDDRIAQLGLHGNPFSGSGTREDFINNWIVEPTGALATGGFYARNYIQFGATLKGSYKTKLFKYKVEEKGKTKEKHRLLFQTSLNLYSNYLRLPQHIDVEWITNIDVFLFKGLSLSLMTNVFWDYDVLVQVDADNDVNTGVNGYESEGRRISFLQSLSIKYNFLF